MAMWKFSLPSFQSERISLVVIVISLARRYMSTPYEHVEETSDTYVYTFFFIGISLSIATVYGGSFAVVITYQHYLNSSEMCLSSWWKFKCTFKKINWKNVMVKTKVNVICGVCGVRCALIYSLVTTHSLTHHEWKGSQSMLKIINTGSDEKNKTCIV